SCWCRASVRGGRPMASDDNARSSSPLLWLFGFLAVGVATLFGLRQAADQPQPAKVPEKARSEKKPDAKADEAASDPLEVLRDFLRVVAAGSEKASDKKEGVGSKKLRPQDVQPGPAEYEFLIVTVPDPVESKFPHEFDAVVDAIQRAFEARGFLVRASRMP